MAKRKFRFYPDKRQVMLLVVMVAAIYVLLPQIGSFRSSWELLSGATRGPAALAVILTSATFGAAAGTYCLLAFKRLAYARTLSVQLAATFVNRLLPAGIGALGANYLYLRHERHSGTQAASVAAVNNLLGFTGHLILIAGALALAGRQALAPEGWHGPAPHAIAEAGAAVLVVLALILLFGRHRLKKALGGTLRQIGAYRKRPSRLLGAQATSLILSILNVLSLYYCAHALGVHLPFVTVLLVFTLGLGAGSAVPTPGGLGGFEAGLAAGFVGYGIDAAPALAIALLYRLISYWLPLLTGAGAFAVCERKGLFDA